MERLKKTLWPKSTSSSISQLIVVALPFIALAWKYRQRSGSKFQDLEKNDGTKDVFQRLQHWANAYIGGGQLSLCNMAIILDEETVFEYSHGVLDVESREKADLSAIFRIFSLTKCVASVGAMILIERDLISLDDPVEKYIPSFANLKVYVSGEDSGSLVTREPSRKMTLRDLLTHQSGLTYGIFGEHPVDKLYQESFSDGMYSLSIEEFIEKLAQLPLLFDPGEHFTYSLSLDVFGYIIEIISMRKYGFGLRDFLKTEILQKLDMEDTDFFVPESKIHRLATLYSTGETVGFGLTKVDQKVMGRNPRELPKLISAGGGLFSTTKDYSKFIKLLVNKGEFNGKRIVSEESIKLFTQENQLGERFCEERKKHVPSDITQVHFDQEVYQNYRFYHGVGWNLMGSLLIDKDRAFGAEHSLNGEYGWSGIGGLWFGVSHLKVMKDGVSKEIGVGMLFMSQSLPDKGLPTQPQFRWASMKSVREHLVNLGYVFQS